MIAPAEIHPWSFLIVLCWGRPLIATAPVAGNTPRTAPSNRTFYPALDGLRAVAVLLVILQHYLGLPWGWSGVNIFFVLSGFLITGILWDTRDDPHRIRNFYIRRTLRIFPLYYGVFLALLLTTPLMHWSWSLAWLAWPLYAGNFLRFIGHGGLTAAQQAVADAQLHSRTNPMVVYLGHFWSLCIEEQFYLLWPWIVFFVRSRRALIVICGSVVVLGPIARLLVQQAAPEWMLSEELLFRFTPFQLDALLFGGMLALLWRGSHRQQLIQLANLLAGACAAIALAYLVFGARIYRPGLWHNYTAPHWRLTWGLSFINLLSGAGIVCAIDPGSPTYRLLHLRPLRALGRISYGAYVFHDIPHVVVVGITVVLLDNFRTVHPPATLVLLPLGLAFTIISASISYKYFEIPFLNLKQRWTHT